HPLEFLKNFSIGKLSPQKWAGASWRTQVLGKRANIQVIAELTKTISGAKASKHPSYRGLPFAIGVQLTTPFEDQDRSHTSTSSSNCSVHICLLSMAIASAIFVAGEAMISASVDGVQNYVFSVAKEEFQSVWYLKDEIKRTSELVETIQGGVEDAEKKQLQDEDVRKWIRDLKNAGYDMEDVLCDYRVVVASVEDGQGVVTRWMSLAKDALCLLCGIPLSCLDIIPFPLTPRVEIAHRLRSINKNLVEINQRKAKLSLDGGMVGEGNGSDPTRRSLGPPLWQYQERPMMGRSETKNKIKEALLSYAAASTKESCSKLFVIGIVGTGGMGKTTLAHNIFSDEDVVEAFSSTEWLYVGEKFDLKRLMNELLGENSQLVREDDLHSGTREKFKDQSLLIVLDDAWHTNRKDWDLLQSSLSKGAKPHALIVTTRNKAVARAIPHECGYLEQELTALPDTECMDIFKRWAFMGQQAEHYPDLEWLSEKVVEKLKGNPLAATMMGRFLNTHLGNRQMWVSIASDVDWPDTDEGNVVDRVVGLSYLHLPPHLKPCFAYCAMFPKGFEFRKERLIRMWIAQGYVRPFGRELMEHTGSAYFDDLCQRSFFQLPNVKVFPDEYIMHDLIHDFAKKVFTEGCRMHAGDTEDGASSKEIRHTEDGTSFEEIRHLSFHCNGTGPPEFKRLLNFKKLRTLMLKSDVTNIIGPLLDVLAKFKYLRLLVLDDYKLTEFPDSIRHLQFLRYLDISRTEIRPLLELLCDLVNLQFLKLPHDCALPEGMNKLLNLRFIEAYDEEVPQFKGIGQLTSLQGRVTIKVQNKSGWKISELKGLNHLHGELVVRGLEHVKSKEEAEQACLKHKVHLEELVLHWGAEEEETVLSSVQQEHAVDSQVQKYVRNNVESQVLEGLFPPPNLKVLRIHNNRGARFPSWMEEHRCSISSSLVTLELDGCCKWECLPTLGRFPSLKVLTITKAHSVKKIGPEFYGEIDNMHGRRINNNKGYSYFPRLEVLYLKEMSVWEEWEMPAAGQIHSGGGGGRHVLFPSLKKLYINLCPKLLTLSPILSHLTNIKEFTVRECPKLASFSAMLCHLTALERLQIGGCDKLVLDGGVAEDDTQDDQETISSVQQPVVIDSQVEEKQVINDAKRETVDGQSPSPYLKDSLTVRGAQLPSWMMERHRLLPSTLVTLELDGCCTYWECLPTLGQLPSLTYLTIIKAGHVRKIGSEFYGGEVDVGGIVYFPHLKLLDLEEMSVWEEWDVPAAGQMDGGGGGGRHGHVLFPSLWRLCIYSCPKLPSLSPVLRHLTNLVDITISGCDELESLEEDGCGWVLPSLHELSIEECPKLASLTPILRRSTNLETIAIKKCAELALLEEEDGCGWVLPSLSQLSIEECPKLASLTPILRRSTNLERIEIKECAELAWSEEGDGCGWMLPSGLKELYIDGNSPKLPSLSQMLPHLTALQQLRIYGFRNLQCLPLSIHNLHSLEILQIEDCPAIECLSDGGLRLHSLRQLWIRGCPLLEGRYREGGLDALNIPTTTEVIISPPLPEG
ncbi:hypothetical protein Taro_044417, partial [Colocasia esculenta]|nr:hypothetical protein [Colocasia esculenta]